MLLDGLSFLTAAGTAYSAYQSFNPENEEYRIVVLTAAGGLLLSLFLQALAGKFSKTERPLGIKVVQVLIGDATSFVSSIVLPIAVIYGFVKKNGEVINQSSFGIIQIEPSINFRGRDVTHLYPYLAGVNVGFFAGQMIGKFISHFVKG